ncbi:MAG TPA: M4 family metallopeptidase [Polyangia bacterium]|jgi:hypothetical protein
MEAFDLTPASCVRRALSRGGLAILAAVGFVSLVACGRPPETSQIGVARSAQSVSIREQAVRDALARLEGAVAARYADYLGSLSAEERATELNSASRELGGISLSVGWSRHATLRGVSSRHMRIPGEGIGTAEDRAWGFLRSYGVLFGLEHAPEALVLVQSRPRNMDDGATVLRFKQELYGLPVFKAHLLLHVGVQGDIDFISGLVVPEQAVIPHTPRLSPWSAAALSGGAAATLELGWFDPEAFGLTDGDTVLAWRLIAGESGDGEEVYVDADSGVELWRQGLARYDKHVETFYCGSSCTLPGQIEHDTMCDAVCVAPAQCINGTYCQAPLPLPGTAQALDTSLSNAYDYYLNRHGRDSWDNNQNPTYHRLRATSDYGAGCQAYWSSSSQNPPAQIVAGPGWTCGNVVTHEMTHGVDSAEGNVAGVSERSSSIAEAFGDAMGEYAEVFGIEFAQPDWLHPTGCTGVACTVNQRNLANPHNASYQQTCNYTARTTPDHLADYRDDCSIQEGHFNNTILGKMAYLMGRDPASGAVNHWGISVTGLGTVDASRVWYAALANYATANENEPYARIKQSFAYACSEIFPSGGSSYDNCLAASDAVGLWSVESDKGFTTDDAVSSSTFNGTPYLFYRSGNSLYSRVWNCLGFPPRCGWKSPTVLETNANSGPTSTVSSNRIFVCYHNTSGGVSCGTYDGGGWHAASSIVASATTETPSITLYWSNYPFLAYRRIFSGRNYVYWKVWDPNTGLWGPESGSGFYTQSAVVVTSTDEDPFPGSYHVYAVYASALTANRLAYREFDLNTGQWLAETLAGRADQAISDLITYGRPAARVFRGNLHIAAPFSTPANSARYMSGLDPYSSWSFYSKLEPGFSGIYSNGLSFSASATGLSLWYRMPSSSNVANRVKLGK